MQVSASPCQYSGHRHAGSYTVLIKRCKDAIAKGTALPYCTLARLLQDPKLGGLDSEDEAAYINLELIGAAADTVSREGCLPSEQVHVT